MEIKVGDIVQRKYKGGHLEPHKVEFVRPDAGKVVLRSTKYRNSMAVTVKIKNIGANRDSGKTYYMEG